MVLRVMQIKTAKLKSFKRTRILVSVLETMLVKFWQNMSLLSVYFHKKLIKICLILIEEVWINSIDRRDFKTVL